MSWLARGRGLAGSALADLQSPPAAPTTPGAVATTALALGLAFALLYQVGVPLRASYGARVNVDEPFYLLTTVSLLADGDLDLANDYALRRYRQFFDHRDELWYQSRPGPDGRVLSPHNVGLSVLLMPAYALAGVDGAKALLGLVGGATVALTTLLAYRATGRPAASALAAAALGGAAPLFVYATQLYPEIPAALAVTWCAWLLLGRQPGPRSAALLALGLGALPWLGSKYGLIAAALGLIALARLRGWGPRALLVALSAANALAYGWFHLTTYGGLTPYGVNRLYVGRTTLELIALHVELWNRLYRLLGLWVDGEFGLVRWAPVLLVALPALAPLLARRGPERWVWPPLLAGQLLIATFLSITMRGWWFPGRMLIVVLPLLAIPLAEALARAAESPLRTALAGAAAAYTAAVTAALVAAGLAGRVALAVDPFELAWPPFRALAPLFPVYTSFGPLTWLLTAAWLIALAALAAAPIVGRAPGLAATRPTRRGVGPSSLA